MAGAMGKQNRNQDAVFQDLLHGLQTWENSLTDKKKMLKHEEQKEKKGGSGIKAEIGKEKRKAAGEVHKPSHVLPWKVQTESSLQTGYLRNKDSVSSLSSGLLSEGNIPDANSEKELGNEYFKQKKFKEAIKCYSQSIALSPTAVAYANRAMAYLKIKRFEDAENDCTEALNLDDRYVKAYSRRATARKELGKLKLSIEDSEFALRLEPNSQELKKQHSEAKALYEKEIIEKASQVMKTVSQANETVEDPKFEIRGKVQEVLLSPSRSQTSSVQSEPRKPLSAVREVENSCVIAASESDIAQRMEAQKGGSQSAVTGHSKKLSGALSKHELKSSMVEVASRAASRAVASSSKNNVTPKSAYQFEVMWRGCSDNHSHLVNLLKTIPPSSLPQLFKNALSAPILVDIVKCIASFFSEEMELAVSFLEHLTQVPRFDMIIMCLSSMDKTDLHKIWEEVFSKEAVPIELTETLSRLRPRYCPGGW